MTIRGSVSLPSRVQAMNWAQVPPNTVPSSSARRRM